MKETDANLVGRPLYIDRIMPFIDKDVIKVLTGLRRSGKSQMLRLLQRRLVREGRRPGQFISLNFEDYSLGSLHDPDRLYAYLLDRIERVDGKPYVFLDEIQEVRDFEKVVNSLRAATRADVIITGSNSTLLSGELATHLAGRYVQFEVYPFGFSEFVAARKSIGADASFDAFLRIGGMPFVATQDLDESSRRTYLTDIYRSVILKDVVRRHNLRDIALLERIILFALKNMGNVLSANSIASYLKSERLDVTPQTVINYMEYCRDVYLLERMSRTDLLGKRTLKTMQKYYADDHGLVAAITGDGLAQIQGVLEDMVAIEALRRGYAVSIGSLNNTEVDFVLAKGEARRYIQVTYLMDADSTENREFSPLESVPDNYPKTVVSMDPVLRPREGIEHRRIDEFLLATDW